MRNLESLRQKIERIRNNLEASAHDVRVLTKILRAGLRYYDPKLKKYRKLDHLARAEAKKLAPVRQAEARCEVITWLRDHGIVVSPPAQRSPPPQQVASQVNQLLKVDIQLQA